MGGKNEIINYEHMNVLHKSGCTCIEEIRSAVKSIEDKLTVLKEGSYSGEKGAEYRQLLTTMSGILNELSRATEKAVFFMDAKLNVKRKIELDSWINDNARKKAQHLILKK